MRPVTLSAGAHRNETGLLRCLGQAALVLTCSIYPSLARAQALRVFRLPREPVEQGIVRFGVQAGVSIGGLPAPGCEGNTRPVLGIMRPAEALRQLLPPGCAFAVLDRQAFVVRGQNPRAAPVAQPATRTTPASALQELVVTAEKRSEPALASPFPVTALSGRDVERLGAKDLSGLATQVAGVTETNLGPGRDKIFIRGISDGAFTGRTQSTVGLYLDDVPVTYNAPDPALRLVDIERVEVLRGPQGTLYGSGSMGGIVRVVTTKPDPDAYSAEASVEGMYNDRQDGSWGLTGVINAPLLQGHAAIRAVAYRDDITGYLDNLLLGATDVNHGRRIGGRVSALLDLSPNWQFQLSAGSQSIYTSDSQYTQGGSVRDTLVPEPHDNDFAHVGFRLSRAAGRSTLRVSGAYIEHDTGTRYDVTEVFPTLARGPAALDEHSAAELWVGEAVYSSVGPIRRLRWLVGGFGSYSEEHDAVGLSLRGDRTTMTPIYARRDRLEEAAVFGEASYDITARLTATVGGRAFSSRVGAVSGGFAPTHPGAVGLRAHRIDDGVTPKLRVSYAFAPDVVAYAQYQQGYRSGGFNIPGSPEAMASGPAAPGFRADRLINYEAGGEIPLLDRTLTVRAALFHIAWRDVQSDQFRPSGLPITLNIGDGTNTGVELEAVWRPTPRFQLRVNGLLNEPELIRARDASLAHPHAPLPGVADGMGSVDAIYRWALVAGIDAELTAQLAYVGRSYLTFDGRTESAMGDYATGRIGAAFEWRRWRLQAYVENVTDERANTFSFGNPFRRDRTVQKTPLRPRTFGLSLRRRL